MISVLRLLALTLLFVPTALFAAPSDCPDLEPTYNETTGEWVFPETPPGCEDVVVVTGRHTPTFADLVNDKIVPFIDEFVLPFLYSIAILVFMFGIFRFFFTGGAENREKGQQFALWGLIGFVVLFSLWGIVNMLMASLLP